MLQHFETLAAFPLGDVSKMYKAQFEVVRNEAASFDVEVLLALPELKLVVPGPDDATASKARRADAQRRRNDAE